MATLVAQALAGGLSLRHYRQLPYLPPAPTTTWPAPPPLLSVIVPARNEEARLGRLLQSLMAQDYPAMEVIVVDDCSTDRTAEVAERFGGVQVIRGGERPPGWAGKPHACARGAARARGSWLLFVDADTAYQRGAFSRALAYAGARRLAFLSLFLQQECRGFWERLLLPYAYAQYFAGVSARDVNAPGRDQALANGQFMLFRRDAYEAVGGHASVKGSLIDDVDMARVLKRQGIAMEMVRAEELGSVHMYDDLWAIGEGFTKNAFAFVRANPRGAPAVIGGALAVGGALPTALSCARRFRRARTPRSRAAALAVGLASYALPASLLAPWYTRFGVDRRYALAHPLAFGVFQTIALTSAWRTLTRQGVTWKGRSYGGAGTKPYYRLPRRQVMDLGVALLTGRRRLLAGDGARLIASLARAPRIEGADRIPATAPFCLAANHYQRWGLWIGWEGGILAATVAEQRSGDRDLHLLVIGGSRLGPLRGHWIDVPGTRAIYTRVAAMWGMVTLPVDPNDTAGRARALRRLLGFVVAGDRATGAIGLFPEGERGGAGGLRPALPGVGTLFLVLGRRGVPVLPAAMFEDDEGLVLRFGDPLLVHPERGADASPDEAAAAVVMRGIAALLPEALRGAYPLPSPEPGSGGGSAG